MNITHSRCPEPAQQTRRQIATLHPCAPTRTASAKKCVAMDESWTKQGALHANVETPARKLSAGRTRRASWCHWTVRLVGFSYKVFLIRRKTRQCIA